MAEYFDYDGMKRQMLAESRAKAPLPLLAHEHLCPHCSKVYQCDDQYCADITEQVCTSCINGEWYEE